MYETMSLWAPRISFRFCRVILTRLQKDLRPGRQRTIYRGVANLMKTPEVSFSRQPQ